MTCKVLKVIDSKLSLLKDIIKYSLKLSTQGAGPHLEHF